MIAVDTSTLSAFLAGEDAADIDALITAIEQEQLALPPIVCLLYTSDAADE